METIKFAYIRDPKNRLRVITIARMVDGDRIFFQTAVNRCKDGNVVKRDTYKVHNLPFAIDTFNKKTARAISEGRLIEKPIIIDKVDGEPPHHTILKYLKNSGTPTERRVCAAWVY